MLVPWFDVDSAFAEMDAMARQIDALLGARGLDGRHGLRTVDAPLSNTVRQDEDAWVYSADLPGLGKDDVQVSYDKGALTISARRAWKAPEGWSARYSERRAFDLSRTLSLPDTVDAEGITASFEHGTLTVRLPKRPAAQPRTITVTTS
jgi:HSP20 family protein